MVFILFLFAGYNIYQAQKDMSTFDLVLGNIDSSADDNEGNWGCGGNPTFVPDKTLKSSFCLNGGTHLKCQKEDGMYCDPSKQTDCKGVILLNNADDIIVLLCHLHQL